ncbi:hypothetical protein [Rufibacter soli]
MIDEIQAYPLQWPLGHKRTSVQRKSRFDLYSLTVAKATQGLLSELEMWKAKGVVISSNAPAKKDNTPYSSFKEPKDSGVAVYFILKGEQRVIPCDEYLTVAENIRAVQYVVEALRTIERHGGAGAFNTAFSGFKALPVSGETRKPEWWETLGISRNANAFQINEAFREKAKTAHPDTGGSNEAMSDLVAARAQGLSALNRTGGSGE